jgi:hypothetical protein
MTTPSSPVTGSSFADLQWNYDSIKKSRNNSLEALGIFHWIIFP